MTLFKIKPNTMCKRPRTKIMNLITRQSTRRRSTKIFWFDSETILIHSQVLVWCETVNTALFYTFLTHSTEISQPRRPENRTEVLILSSSVTLELWTCNFAPGVIEQPECRLAKCISGKKKLRQTGLDRFINKICLHGFLLAVLGCHLF